MKAALTELPSECVITQSSATDESIEVRAVGSRGAVFGRDLNRRRKRHGCLWSTTIRTARSVEPTVSTVGQIKADFRCYRFGDRRNDSITDGPVRTPSVGPELSTLTVPASPPFPLYHGFLDPA